jgi:hypothetical protein
MNTAHAAQRTRITKRLVVVGRHGGLGLKFANQFVCMCRPGVTYVLSIGVTSHD